MFTFFFFFFFILDPNPGQVQLNPQTGQPDYSIQWAEYYRSLGMHREAEMIEQQAKASKVLQELCVPFKAENVGLFPSKKIITF